MPRTTKGGGERMPTVAQQVHFNAEDFRIAKRLAEAADLSFQEFARRALHEAVVKGQQGILGQEASDE